MEERRGILLNDIFEQINSCDPPGLKISVSCGLLLESMILNLIERWLSGDINSISSYICMVESAAESPFCRRHGPYHHPTMGVTQYPHLIFNRQ